MKLTIFLVISKTQNYKVLNAYTFKRSESDISGHNPTRALNRSKKKFEIKKNQVIQGIFKLFHIQVIFNYIFQKNEKI